MKLDGDDLMDHEGERHLGVLEKVSRTLVHPPPFSKERNMAAKGSLTRLDGGDRMLRGVNILANA